MRALITGITGQDGSYLAELLLDKAYDVHGVVRRSSSFNTGRIDHIFDKLTLHFGDVTDAACCASLVRKVRPNELYHLAGMSHVKVSFEQPLYTADCVALSAIRLLEAIRDADMPCKFYNAASSEMFGNAHAPQSETTPMKPVSPYGIAKLHAYHVTRMYREAYGIFAVNGILFNHESPRRGPTFVTRKITRAIAAIKAGRQDRLVLGNLDSKRDWGHAKDYVRAMWLMMQYCEPDDFVISTGMAVSVRSFCKAAFGVVGLDFKDYITQDIQYTRPIEIAELRGDFSKAKVRLRWEPTVSFYDLVTEMVDHDMRCMDVQEAARG